MTTRLSPGVSAREVDLTLTIAPTFLRQGAISGNFAWGPSSDPILINDENNLVEVFLEPTDDNFNDWFLASTYLRESRGLRVNRIVREDAYNAIVGGSGVGLTLDTSVVNGEISSVAINTSGSGYTSGDIVEVENGLTVSEVRVLSVDGVGGVQSVQLLSNGSGYVTTTGETTNARSNFQVRNDFDFDQNVAEFPEIIARFPGSFGNNLGFSIMRASEFFGNQFQDRFRIQPTATNAFFDGDGFKEVFEVGAAVVGDADRVVTINNVTISEGVQPGEYTASGTTIEIHGDEETFSGNDLTSTFTLANAGNLDLFTATVVVDGNILSSRFDGTGHVEPGFFDIDPTSRVLTIGTDLDLMSGDSATLIYQITTNDALDDTNTRVSVDSVDLTVVTTAPAIGEVQIQAITGGYSFTFNAADTPNAGIDNIEIEWGFVPTGTNNVEVIYGLPNGTDSLKVFTNQESVHVVVFDRTGNITGTVNGTLEVYDELSLDPNARFEDGTSSYYVDALNLRSEYIRVTREVTTFFDYILSNGTNGSELRSSDYQNGYQVFSNRDDFDITYIIDPVIDASLSQELLTIAEDRGDAVAFLGAPRNTTLNASNPLSNSIAHNNLLRSSSFGIFEPSFQQIVDRFNSKTRWIPNTGNHAGIYARTHSENNLWTAAAGLNRGQLRFARNVSYLPNESDRDELYQNNINFNIRDMGRGFYLFGQKTMLQRNSAFNRANVRFLSIAIKRGITEALRFVLFEINDEITRANVRNLINPFLRDIQAQRGISDYEIVVDSRNNTPVVIDRNELKIDIYIQPTRTIEFIQLSLIFTRTGAVFEELINGNSVDLN